MRKRLQALAVCALLALAACGTGESPTIEPPEGEGETSVGLRATVVEDGVEVEAFPSNFEVVNKLGQDPVDGEGHIHFYIDVEELPTTAGQPAVTDDEATYHASATTTYTWPGVEKGEHKVAVQLVNNNHTPLEPPVTSETTVTVE